MTHVVDFYGAPRTVAVRAQDHKLAGVAQPFHLHRFLRLHLALYPEALVPDSGINQVQALVFGDAPEHLTVVVPLERPGMRTYLELVRLPRPLNVPNLDALVHTRCGEGQVHGGIPLAEHNWFGMALQLGECLRVIYVPREAFLGQHPDLSGAVT